MRSIWASVLTFLFVTAVWNSVPTSAVEIAWVHQLRGPTWEEDQWRALLEAKGHTIVTHDRFDELDLTPEGLDELNSVDLVIFSRDSNSANYNDSPVEAETWTSGVTAPMLILTPFVMRNNRWSMVDADTIVVVQDSLQALDTSHPVFSGVSLDANNQVAVWDDALLGPDDNINLIQFSNVGNGTLIASEANTGNPWIIHWEAGVEFYDNSGTFAGGPRMFFSAGSDDDPNTWGAKNITPQGDLIFLNAVSFLAGINSEVDVIYTASTGEISLDVTGEELTSFLIQSQTGIFNADPAANLGGDFDIDRDDSIFKASFGSNFGSLSFGTVAPAGLTEDFLLSDLTFDGSLDVGSPLQTVNLVYELGAARLQAGDADQDLDVDQLDIVKVLSAGKYLTGQVATWGQGDWDGAPGGSQGNPPPGNGRFDQLDIVAALDGGTYLTGPYAAVMAGGTSGDAQTSISYNPSTGEVAVDAPSGSELTSINIDSAAGIFTSQPAQNLGGSFDNDTDDNIFKATFGGSFGTITFGNVAIPGLSEEFVLGDLTIVGSLAGGGPLGDVDLIYVPEPSANLLATITLLLVAGCGACSKNGRAATPNWSFVIKEGGDRFVDR